jgi:hypothetical protein
MLASATRAGTTSSTKPGHAAAGAVRGAGAVGSGTPVVVVTEAGQQEVTVSQFVAQLGSFLLTEPDDRAR